MTSPVDEGFKQWLNGLNVADHGEIPDDWFEEFWQHTLQCKLENSSVPQVLLCFDLSLECVTVVPVTTTFSSPSVVAF